MHHNITKLPMALVLQTVVQDRPAAAQGQKSVPVARGRRHPLIYYFTEKQQFCLMGISGRHGCFQRTMVCVISAEDMQETSSPDEGQHNDGSALTAMAAEHRGLSSNKTAAACLPQGQLCRQLLRPCWCVWPSSCPWPWPPWACSPCCLPC